MDPESTVAKAGRLAIYTEAFVALVCLFGLMFGDPGVVKRSPETCFPLPPKVADLIEAGATSEQIQQLGNLHGEKGSFCVRCLVLGDNVQPHHCSTCQRCVTHFDHHCGVFGRCIAGDGLRGNMGFFKVLISMAGAGIFTAMSFSIFGVADTYNRGGSTYLSGLGLVMAAASCCCCCCVMCSLSDGPPLM
eukprot:CAMPEP_0181237124 /NCGR_PEP_ID=MMETSP1096-20121128/38581_1 /TAXON_ID=156174 ORGANISM="Chrysochromulina ericina, Strain CCMP281" /NCGR_SAMPLE_ID=MMETSP1096 /ASSEMBLY_ACC=CAM_ASM_000453 /LENGTH=189 /DNA_ID=CAMNT_0023332429 /DNA_START=105 /DNA_END=674 /DNA_ORIENTATION=-